MSKKVIYIAGPITGVPHYWEAFEAAEEEIEAHGCIALNPARLPEGMSNKQYAQICTGMIHSADGVLLLNNWPSSKGATLEKKYCEYIGRLHSTRLDILVAALMER